MATSLDELVVLVELPRGGRSKASCTLSLEVGVQAAGCVICDRPIPPRVSRLKIVLSLRGTTGPMPWPGTVTHFMHPGCVTDAIRPEIARKGRDCYDCGQLTTYGSAFTVSEFAYAPICRACATSRRWAYCSSCCAHFPVHMVDELDGENVDRARVLSDDQLYVCRRCSSRYSIPTKADQAEQAAERLRVDAEYQARRDWHLNQLEGHA